MDFVRGLRSYSNNFVTCLGFALLLVFVLPFAWLTNSFVSSGTVLMPYSFLSQPLFNSVFLLLLGLVFLFAYSVLVCLIVFAVRRDLSAVRVNYYIRERIQKFGYKYFVFLAAFMIIATAASSLLIGFGVPVPAINIALFLASASFLFLPQTIVVDEESLESSIARNWGFIRKNFFSFLLVMLFGVLAVFFVQAGEFLIDYYLPGGGFISLLLSLVFLVPFIEVIKTEIYMNRFELVKHYERFASK